MLPKIEVRHLNAVIALAEELNFTRAAHKLHITQPALSRQITEIEQQNRLRLFARSKGRAVELVAALRGTIIASQVCYFEQSPKAPLPISYHGFR